MTFQLVGGDTGNLDAVVNQVNQNIAQLKVQDTTNIFKDDAGTRRVLLGKGKDGFYGLKVSREGTDVYDGSNEDMIFNSNNNSFKIIETGTTTIDATSAVAGVPIEATIAHDYDFAPVALVFMDYGGTYSVQLPACNSFNAVAGFVNFANWSWATTNTENLFISFLSGSTADWGTLSYKYYLLQETAN